MFATAGMRALMYLESLTRASMSPYHSLVCFMMFLRDGERAYGLKSRERSGDIGFAFRGLCRGLRAGCAGLAGSTCLRWALRRQM